MNDHPAQESFDAGHATFHAEGAPPPLLDLPPVEAPSAGFIIQLFVIPAIVVAVVIVVWLLFGKLAHGERDAMEYVRQLRSPSANWRLAHELASLINNDPRLANDPVLLGEMTDLLAYELDHNEDTRLTQFVTHAVGTFQAPEARTSNGQPIDPIVPLARALGPKLDLAIRIAAASSLAKRAAQLQGRLEDERAVNALAEATTDANPDLRQVATYALGFFGGEHASHILREAVAGDSDRFARYNAAIALTRRGDMAASGTLREMLTTALLDKALAAIPEVSGPTERQSKIESIELEALQALEASLATAKPELARSLRPEIEQLTKSGLVSVRSLALAVLQKLPESG